MKHTHIRKPNTWETFCGEATSTTISLEHYLEARTNPVIREHIERLPEKICKDCVVGGA